MAAAAAELAAHAFPQLPLDFVLAVFAQLPADQRLRCAEVSRAWRATVALPELWRRLDLSPASGVAQPPTPALLHAAVARAGSALTMLDVSCRELYAEAVCVALRAAGAVTELRTGGSFWSAADVETVTAATPQLREFHADVSCRNADAAFFLEPPAALRVRALRVYCRAEPLPPALSRALQDGRLHPGLSHLDLSGVDLGAPGAMDAVVEAMCVRPQLTALVLDECIFSPAAAPALAHALQRGALTALELGGNNLATLLDEVGGAAAVGDALRECRSLTTLCVVGLVVEALSAAATAALLGALVGHASLRKLELSYMYVEDRAAAGAALAAILEADAPALTELVLHDVSLEDAGLGAVCNALPRNTHLRILDVRDVDVHAGFMRQRLLPAVRANAGLRELCVVPEHSHCINPDDLDAARTAERFVAAR